MVRLSPIIGALAATFLLTSTEAHEEHPLTPAQLHRRNVALSRRETLVKRCMESNGVGITRRALQKREVKLAALRPAGSLAKRWDPHYSTLQNTTCVLMPEVTEGPYWIQGELVRQDLTDNMPGVPLYLDIGVIDMSTCQPLTGAYVDIWSASAWGEYSGYTGLYMNMTGGGGNMTSGGVPPNGTFTGSAPSAMPTGNFTGGAPGNVTGGPGGNGTMSGGFGAGSAHDALTDSKNFGRGAWPVNDAGIVEFKTIVAGNYQGRTAHIHMKVHINATVHSNGTLIGGKTVHTGQIFLPESLKPTVFALDAYQNGVTYMTNAADSIFLEETANGNNPIMDVEYIGTTIEEGIVGYLTVGVDLGFDSGESSAPWYGTYVDEQANTSSASDIGDSSVTAAATLTSTVTVAYPTTSSKPKCY
ncbi:hypothetical protein HDV00_011911 [Rhizophlyctis rosea]|nr:hypothetical protein HDV00_011911 [Rhizophlyctis rosea]